MKKKIYFWACDYSTNSGEGILGRSYIKHLIKNNKNIKLININYHSKYQRKNIKKNRYIFKSIYHKYVYPIVGLFYLWKLYFKSKNLLYLNYIPLWNFIIFLFLPPKCKIGPVTGTLIKKKYYLLINLFEKISILIIKIRYQEIIFSNNFFKFKYNLVGKKFKFNFILNDFKVNFSKKKKLFDLIIYYRNLSPDYNKYLYNLINKLRKEFKIAVIGDKIKLKDIKNFGFVKREKAKKIIARSSYAINNPENLYSFFFQDCMSYNLTIFYNSFFKKYNIFKNKKLITITNFDSKVDYNKISRIILTK